MWLTAHGSDAYLPEQEHQQGEHQDTSEDRYQYDPPGDSAILGHRLLWEHRHPDLEHNATLKEKQTITQLNTVTLTWNTPPR